MAGVPVQNVSTYITRLLNAGEHVALCEQVSRQRGRGNKEIIERKVTRLYTPGTLVDEVHLSAKSSSYVLCMRPVATGAVMWWADVSTGVLRYSFLSHDQVASEIVRVSPKEVLAPEVDDIHDENNDFGPRFFRSLLGKGISITHRPSSYFDSLASARQLIGSHILPESHSWDVADAHERCSSALLRFIGETHGQDVVSSFRLRQYVADDTLEMDSSTRVSFELVRTRDGLKRGSILDAVDYTSTAMGGRLLSDRLSSPSTNIDEIRTRFDIIDALKHAKDRTCTCGRGRHVPFLSSTPKWGNCVLCTSTRSLRSIPDVHRSLQRLRLGRGGPRDLRCVAEGQLGAARLLDMQDSGNIAKQSALHSLVDGIRFNVTDTVPACEKVVGMLRENPPIDLRDGGYIAKGVDEILDELRAAQLGRVGLDELQAEYRKETGIRSLKVGRNNAMGFFVEVPQKHDGTLPPTFRHCQTLARRLRYKTVELSVFDVNEQDREREIAARERQLFDECCEQVLQHSKGIVETGELVAQLDVGVSSLLASLSHGLVEPVVTADHNHTLELQQCRHLTVEEALKSQLSSGFVANDVSMQPESLMILTGANMAGKSTYLRQVGLCVVLAQSGMHIPAQAGHIPIFQSLFSRVGANDDIRQNFSTFMVEVSETARILNRASSRSLVLIDELGRGTSHIDGLAIASAVALELCENCKSFSILSTHLHELSALESVSDRIRCSHMQTRMVDGDIEFSYKIRDGAAQDSCGLEVAKLAGVPASVLERAHSVKRRLDEQYSTLSVRTAISAEGGAEKMREIERSESSSFQEQPFPRENSGLGGEVDTQMKVIASILRALDMERVEADEAKSILAGLVAHSRMGAKGRSE
uniref:DNA mismatch repair proteins mutS family domain-containing protein n=1 Tax=Palpitomonas bilix TaxID=652834 RepID=A0A7S3D650_9EUKA